MTAPEGGSMGLTVESCHRLTGPVGGLVWHFVQSVFRTPLYKSTRGCVLYDHL